MPVTATETGGSLFGGLTLSEEPFATLADGDLQITFQLGIDLSVTGVSATGGVGSVSAGGSAVASVTGLEATGGVGSLAIDGDSTVSLTGVGATGGVGSATITEGVGPAVAITSPSLQGSVGVASATGELSVLVTGVAGTGETSGASVVSWNEITPNQDPNWTEIAA